MPLPGASIAWKAVAACLFIEAVRSVSWIGRILSVAAVYDVPVFVMVGLRALVTAWQMAAAARLWQGVPIGRKLAEPALLASAALVVFEIGFRLSPSSVVPGHEWPIAAAYAGYAVAAIALLRATDRGK